MSSPSAPFSFRTRRRVLIAALFVAVGVLLWISRYALLPYLLGLAFAYLLLPLVNRLELLLARALRRPRAARGLAILIGYLLAGGLFLLFLYLLLPVLGAQFGVLWESRDQIVQGAMALGERLLTWYRASVPVEIQSQVTQTWQGVAAGLMQTVHEGAKRSLDLMTSTVSFLLGLLVIPFWLFYVLLDQGRTLAAMLRATPERYRADVLNVLRIADDTLSAYLRGQLLLCLFLGIMATAGLAIIGVRFPAVLGLIAGALEILPFIGPILGAVPAVIVAAVQSPLLGLWTVVLFVVIQQIEGSFLAPRVSSAAVHLHPALIIIVLVVGNQVAGIWGMLIAVPVTAIVRDLVKYMFYRMQDEPASPREALLRVGRTPRETSA